MRNLSKDELIEIIELNRREIGFLKRALALAMNRNARGALDAEAEVDNDNNPVLPAWRFGEERDITEGEYQKGLVGHA